MYTRTEMLIGQKNMEKLKESHVAVFGIGGVGSYICEALARAGIGHLTIVDHDTVSASNINRQIIALHSTIGEYKVDVMKKRILDINPEVKVDSKKIFLLPENDCRITWNFSYIADAIDNITAKLYIIEKAKENKIPVISSMGTGNKLDGSRFKIDDISNTAVCPLAKVMRKELKKRDITGVKVLFSDEQPKQCHIEDESRRKSAPASISFVPSAAGLLIAGEIIKDLCVDEY